MGHAFNKLAYNFFEEKLIPQIGQKSKHTSYFKSEDIKYYNVPTPFTELFFKTTMEQGQLSDAPKNKMAKWDAIFEENRFLKCKSSTEEKKLQVFEVCRWDGCDYVLDAVYDQPMYIGRVEMKLNEGKKRKFIYFQTDYKIKKRSKKI